VIPFRCIPYATGVLLRVPHQQFPEINALMEDAGFVRDFAGVDREDPTFDLLTYRKPATDRKVEKT
jgi:hypothetical protein